MGNSFLPLLIVVVGSVVLLFAVIGYFAGFERTGAPKRSAPKERFGTQQWEPNPRGEVPEHERIELRRQLRDLQDQIIADQDRALYDRKRARSVWSTFVTTGGKTYSAMLITDSHAAVVGHSGSTHVLVTGRWERYARWVPRTGWLEESVPVSGWHHRSGIEGRFIIGDSETLEGWQLW